MTTPVGQETSISYGAYPFTYINGLQISNDATTPNTVLDIGSGVTIDSTDTFQMINNGTITINAATNGLNGLDTGTFAEATVYAVYLVSDPVTLQPIGGMISTSLTGPLMPFGYSAWRLIGFATTISNAAHFLPGYWTAGNAGYRLFMYDAPQATLVTSGTSTTYANINLITLVPNFNNLPVLVYSKYTPNTAGNVLDLQPGNATGTSYVVTGQVATVAVTTTSLVLAQQVTLTGVVSPVINYKVSSGSDAAIVDVAGYYFVI